MVRGSICYLKILIKNSLMTLLRGIAGNVFFVVSPPADPCESVFGLSINEGLSCIRSKISMTAFWVISISGSKIHALSN